MEDEEAHTMAVKAELNAPCGDRDLAYGQTPDENYTPGEAEEFVIDAVDRKTRQHCAGCGEVIPISNRTLPNIHHASRTVCHVLINGTLVSGSRGRLGLQSGQCLDSDFDTTALHGETGAYMPQLHVAHGGGEPAVVRSPLDGLIYPNYDNPDVRSSGGVFRCICARLRAPLRLDKGRRRVDHDMRVNGERITCYGPLSDRPETGPWRRDGTVAMVEVARAEGTAGEATAVATAVAGKAAAVTEEAMAAAAMEEATVGEARAAARAAEARVEGRAAEAMVEEKGAEERVVVVREVVGRVAGATVAAVTEEATVVEARAAAMVVAARAVARAVVAMAAARAAQ